MMTFINEKISEEDKAQIDWNHYQKSTHSRAPFDPFMWTIDRERDVFLVEIGKKFPGPEPGKVAFGFSWKGVAICFLADVSLKDEPGSTKSDIYWEIDLVVPDFLISEKEEIQTALKEAIEAHGHWYSGRDKLRNVYISIR